jgi:hypothetical protein
MYNFPVNAVACLGAFNNDLDYEGIDRLGGGDIKRLVIVSVCKATGGVSAHVVNLMLMESFWYKWVDNLSRFWMAVLKHKKV